MAPDRLSRNDLILLVFLCAMLAALVLVAYAPVADKPTLTMRLWAIAESPISIATVSTLIAAFAGTWGAQLLAERKTARRLLLSEIRATNAAIALVYNITNTYIAAKKQHISRLVRDYDAQVAARKVNTAPTFTYQLNLETISAPFSPIEELLQLLRERVTPDGSTMVLVTPLVQSINGFGDTTSKRNEWIAEIRALSGDGDRLKAAWFFGLPYALGRTDDRYPKFIRALENQTDDCIAFSMLVGQTLTLYGDRLAARFGKDSPRIARADLTNSEFFPDMSHYRDWPVH